MPNIIVWLLFVGTGPSMSYMPPAAPIVFKSESGCMAIGAQIKAAADKIGGRTTFTCVRIEGRDMLVR